MFRDIDITYDASSWPEASAPGWLANIQTPRLTNIFLALLHIAFRTRPPQRYGFYLSDLWAWLRYGWAIGRGPELRLRPEWDDVDSHQKMVLSDDFGMGFTTQLLAEEANLTEFADTRRFIRVLYPDLLNYRSEERKRGPQKSPDFIAFDSDGLLHIIECKGTQTSHNALESSMRSGIDQKGNVTGENLGWCVSIGLFIPPARSRERPRIHIIDPHWPTMEKIFHDFHTNQLTRAVNQVVLAKYFCMLNANFTADAMCKPLSTGHGLPDDSKRELQPIIEKSELHEHSVTFNMPGLKIPSTDTEVTVKFRIHEAMRTIENLLQSQNLPDTIDDITNAARSRSWIPIAHKDGASLTTPFGFQLEVSGLPEDLP